ncbi:serine hydrolase [Romeriopsis navalis]|uniref:serine hydrolase n=1 Tax=Romeriopsis navalis TaxID=2992132 RepID=UPI0021F820CC|nr:serine hydrolase [Romeriopsis navalis]
MARRGAGNPREANQRRSGGTKRRRDRKSSGGNLFAALLGLSQGRSSRGVKAKRSRRKPKSATTPNRLVNLRTVTAGAGGRSRRAPAAVIPFERQSNRSRRRPARRRSTTAPQNLVQLPVPRTTSGKLMLYGARLVVFGVGIGVLAGTMLSVWDPASRLTAGSPSNAAKVAEVKPVAALQLGQEIADLKGKVVALVGQQKESQAGVMLLDLDNNAYVDVNASEVFPAASTIKFPILVAFFQDVDAGKIRLTESLAMQKSQVAKEAGSMQYQPVGTEFTALETATNMMVVSDNTATNMLIDRLGGMSALNQRFQSWGLNATVLQNPLPDIKATNTTSPKDLAALMSQVQKGQLISMKSRDRLLAIMRQIQNDSLLPQGLGKGATIAHKTGTLGVLLGDIGLIDTANGKSYLASVLVKRPRNDLGAEQLVQQISRVAYQRFNQVQGATQKFERPRIAQPPN